MTRDDSLCFIMFNIVIVHNGKEWSIINHKERNHFQACLSITVVDIKSQACVVAIVVGGCSSDFSSSMIEQEWLNTIEYTTGMSRKLFVDLFSQARNQTRTWNLWICHWRRSMFALLGIFGIRVWAVHKWRLVTTRLLFFWCKAAMNCGCTPRRDTQIRNLRRVPRCSKSLQNSSSHQPPLTTINNHTTGTNGMVGGDSPHNKGGTTANAGAVRGNTQFLWELLRRGVHLQKGTPKPLNHDCKRDIVRGKL